MLVEVTGHSIKRNGKSVNQERILPAMKFSDVPVDDDGTTRPVVLHNVYPIKRLERPITRKKKANDQFSITEHYFPLALAYSMTVHKAQGATNKYAIVDIPKVNLPNNPDRRDGKTVKNGQMAYVALSRVTEESGLCLLRPVTLDDLNAINYCADREHLMAEIDRLKALQAAVLRKLGLDADDRLVEGLLEIENRVNVI